MDHNHSDDSVRSQKLDFPKVYVSQEHDFASVKLSPELEARSYMKDGLIISEDQSGNIIEVQILNLSEYKSSLPHTG